MAEQMGLKVGQAEPFGRQEKWILQRLVRWKVSILYNFFPGI